MDENGYMMGIARNSKMVFSKYQKQAFMNQAKNWKWASLIEAINTSSLRLLLFVILKDKKWKDDWYIIDMQPDDRISLKENGWAYNKVSIKELKTSFELATKYEL